MKIYPTPRYDDPRAAHKWLERVIGFEPVTVHEGENDTIEHAEMRWGEDLTMFDAPTEALPESPVRAVEHLRLVLGELKVADVRTHVALTFAEDLRRARPAQATSPACSTSSSPGAQPSGRSVTRLRAAPRWSDRGARDDHLPGQAQAAQP